MCKNDYHKPEDSVWYSYGRAVCGVREPQRLTSRELVRNTYAQIPPQTWRVGNCGGSGCPAFCVYTSSPGSLLHTQAQEPVVLGDPTLPNPLMSSFVTNSLPIWLLKRYISSLVPRLMHPDHSNTDHINQDPIYLTSIDCHLLTA